ncbi:type II toxin-antitoxin system TacA family antitoxin [Maricaulis maris]|uniref:Uncharacterized protein (DUF1778 family) n=1 Tax=Maricaulis maris TaxID=74318 RepID=A0A495D472_9PROT|nr:DUF1778 domain-containing protein [Maricaulis maris]RKQ95579.1 uncharacterized protein (DUF1778 family) [Maricaulis maris]
MTKDRQFPGKAKPGTPLAVADQAGTTKGSINLRIEGQTRTLIDEAAASLGKSRTEFMIDTARSRAIDVLLDRRLFQLDPDAFDAFADALETPADPGEKLTALMQRRPAWTA